jgi:hypothetical protein
MNLVETKPMTLHSHVYTTTNYDLFKSIKGNRNINHLHLARLKKSIVSNYLITVLIVNEKYEIIDGQHRFESIKELQLPIYFIVCEGYGLKEVQILNQNSKTWNIDDYLDGYCRLGYPEYLKYRDFINKYNFTHTETMCILNDSNHMINADVKRMFAKGLFKIRNPYKSTDLAEKITAIGKYYAGYKRRPFVLTMLKLNNNELFDFNEFIRKLEFQPTALVDCVKISQYLALVEEIYNFKRRDKVNLKYTK